jgi:hypothetical protein
MLKPNLISQNQKGAMVMIELAQDGQNRYADYRFLKDEVPRIVHRVCNSSERSKISSGMMGQLAMELASQACLDSFLFFFYNVIPGYLFL